MAGWCSFLTVLAQWVAPITGISHSVTLFNLLISISCILITAILGNYIHNSRQQINRMEQIITLCAWTKKIKVGDQWLSMEEYLSSQLGIKCTHGMSEAAAAQFIQESGLEVKDTEAVSC